MFLQSIQFDAACIKSSHKSISLVDVQRCASRSVPTVMSFPCFKNNSSSHHVSRKTSTAEHSYPPRIPQRTGCEVPTRAQRGLGTPYAPLNSTANCADLLHMFSPIVKLLVNFKCDFAHEFRKNTRCESGFEPTTFCYAREAIGQTSRPFLIIATLYLSYLVWE